MNFNTPFIYQVTGSIYLLLGIIDLKIDGIIEIISKGSSSNLFGAYFSKGIYTSSV